MDFENYQSIFFPLEQSWYLSDTTSFGSLANHKSDSMTRKMDLVMVEVNFSIAVTDWK